ncbi:MAG: D-alanine--D-alanine ligase family protein [Bacillota bacterium]|nr:D-alanine--D-alanine ligase family protein [Bacillota bacterium]
MKKLNVAVIFGGYSSEYAVSLKSAHNVITHLDREKYEIIPVGITKNGDWFRYYGDIDKIITDEWNTKQDCSPIVLVPDRSAKGILEIRSGAHQFTKIDVLFPVIHGRTGEDGCLQGLFELTGIPYVGCGVLSSAIGMDKDIAHRIVQTIGVKTTKYVVADGKEAVDDIIRRAEGLTYPLFIKPACAGSSIGVSEVTNIDEFKAAVEEAAKYGSKIKIEEKVVGSEVGCSIMGTGDNLVIGEVDEIVLEYGFLNTHLQANPEKGSVNSSIRIPAAYPEEIREKIKETAVAIYKVMECKGLARVDMFVTKDNEIYLNEVNTMPGFTTYSRFPLMMQGKGIEIEEVLDFMINDALTR